MEVTPALLEAIKNQLDITWPDPEGDKKLTAIIQDGVFYLNRIAGEELKYLSPGSHSSLLREYCRYSREGVLNRFETDYIRELNELQMDCVVKRHAADL